MMSKEIGIIEYDKLQTATYLMYNNTALTTVQCDFPVLTDGRSMFSGCTALTSFSSDLSSLIYGSNMFEDCSNLESFSSDSSGSPMNLTNLRDGFLMFYECSKLTTFTSNLPSLNAANAMFQGTNLTTFSSNLSSLACGNTMFSGCENLISFTSDLPMLMEGDYMFYECTKLTTFNSVLSSLMSGDSMFYRCKLNETSLRNIADNINNLVEKGYDRDNDVDWTYEVLGRTETISSSHRGRIDIGHDENVSQEVLQYCGNKLIDKGWDVYFDGTLYKYATPYDVSEANGWCPNAYKSYDDNWNKVVLTPNMDVLKISIVNEKGEMLNDE